MKYSICLPLFLLLCCLTTFCHSQQESNRSNFTITRDAVNVTGEHKEEWHFYDAYLSNVDDTTYLKVKTVPTSKDNAVHIFISDVHEEPNYKLSEYKSIEAQSLIIITNSFYRNKTKIVIGVQVTNTSSSYVITVQAVDEIQLEKDMAIDMLLGSMTDYVFTYEPPAQTDEDIMFTAIGPNIQAPEMLVKYGDKEFKTEKLFDNGKGVLIPSSSYTYAQGTKFNITITSDISTLLQIAVKHVVLNEATVNNINTLEHVVIILDNQSVKSQCYHIEPVNKASTDNSTRHFMANIKSFTQNAHVYVYNPSTKEEVNAVDVVSSGYLQFDYESTWQLCIKATQGNTKTVTAQFQVYDMDYYYENQAYKDALIRGITHEELVPKGKVMYYRIPSLSPFSEDLQMNIHFIKGYPRLYKGYCSDYPNCIITADNITTLEQNGEIQTAHDINENIFLKAKVRDQNVYQSSVQTIAIVYCPDDENENVVDCIFDISIKCEDDITSLLPDTRYSRPIQSENSDFFKFEITDDTVERIYVVLYSYSGNGDLYVSTSRHFEYENGTYYADGNREYFLIDKQTSKSLLGQFYVRVAAAKDTYYTVFYYTETSQTKEFEVPSGEVFMETITKREKKKTYCLHNRNTENNVPFLASVHSINCAIDVTFDGKTYSNRLNQFVIDPSDAMYKEGKYKFEITFVSFDSLSVIEDERCMFYIAGDESMQENELLLNEGVFHQMAFNNKINYISYVYPLVYSGPARIIFSFNKYSDLNLKINYKFQGREGSQGIISTHHRKIEIEISEIEEHCSLGEPCPLLIAVEPEHPITKPDVELRYQIEVLSSAGIPSYLTVGEIRFNQLNGKKYNVAGSPNVHYYYTDLAEGTSGDINIDFLRGSGNAVARIVRKDDISMYADWNRRVELPTQNSEGVKRLNYYDKKFTITSTDTKNCEQGCEIYIQVYTDNQYSDEKKVDYTIVFRRNDTVSTLPLNEIVSNTLYGTIGKNVFNYFQSTIYKDSNRFVLSVDCDLCVVYVNYGTTVPTKDQYDWTFDSNYKHFAIYETDPKLNKTTLFGETFTFAVGATAVNGLAGAYYNIKASAPDRSLQMVHEINSAHDEICQIEEPDGKCFLILPIYAGESGKNIYVYALNEGVNSTRVEIYAKFFDIQDYIKHSPEVLIENFPNSIYYEFSSENEEISSLLDIPLKKRDVDRYLALTVQSAKPAELRILTTFFTTPRGADFRPHTNELFVLKPGHQLDLLLGGPSTYYTEFVVIQGQMTVYNDKDNLKYNEEPTTLDSEDVDTLGNIMTPGNLFIHHYIDATYKYQLTVFFVRYTTVTTEGYFSGLKYGRQNNLHYHEENPFPIEFYAPLKDNHKDLLFNIHLDQLKKGDTLSCSDNFNVTAYVVSEPWIIKRKGDKTLVPDTNVTGHAKYEQSLQLARIKFYKEDYNKVNSDLKYLYIKINPVAENVHNYTQVSTISSIFPINVDIISIPNNEYYYGEMGGNKHIEIFSLMKKSVYHVIMDIEYSNYNKEDFGFSLNPVDKWNTKVDYYQNSSYLDIVERVENSGRVILTVDSSVFNELHFAIFRKNSTKRDKKAFERKDNFVIKYRSSTTYIPHFTVHNPTLNIEINKNIANINATYPKHSNNQFLLTNTRFTLKLYRKEDYNDISELNTFSPKIEPVYTNSNFNHSNTLHVFFNNIPYDEKGYYVTLEAVGMDTTSSELLLYEVGELDVLITTVTLVIIIICAVIGIVVLSIGGYFLYKKIVGDAQNNPDFSKLTTDFDGKLENNEV